MSEGRTNGGHGGMSGAGTDQASRRLVRAGLTVVVLGMLLQAIVNGLSAVEDRRALGTNDPAWTIWTWELTSFAAWLVMLLAIWWLVRVLHPPLMR